MMKNGKGRRFLASLLSFIMIVNMIPESALMVYAEPGDPEAHVHCACASDTSCGEAHNAETEWTAWDPAANNNALLPATAGYYYLTQDITLDNNYTAEDGLFLCLNGHTVNMNGYMYSCSGTLTITNCSDEGGFVEENKSNKYNKYLLDVRNLNMYKVGISVNNCTYYYSENSLTGYSGGSDTSRSVYYLEDCTFSVTDEIENRTEVISGVYLNHTDTVTVKNTSINIDTGMSARGIYISDANDTVTLVDTSVNIRFDNIYWRDSTQRSALAVYSNMESGDSLIATGCIFSAETENSIGTSGVLFNEGCDYTFTSCEITAASAGNCDAYGVDCGYTYGSLEFSDCDISACNSVNKGYVSGIECQDANIIIKTGTQITSNGVGINFHPSSYNDKKLTVTDSTITVDRLGIYQYPYNKRCSTDIKNSVVTASGQYNTSSDYGYAVRAESGNVYLGGSTMLGGTNCGLYVWNNANIYAYSTDETGLSIDDGDFIGIYKSATVNSGSVIITDGMTEALVGKLDLVSPENYNIGSDGKAIQKTLYSITTYGGIPGCKSYSAYADPECTNSIWRTYEGRKVYVNAVAKNHYVFDRWIITGATLDEDVTVVKNSFTMGKSAVDLKPSFSEAPHWTVTYNSGALADRPNITETASKYAGEDLTISGSGYSRTGYTQTGWSLTDNGDIAYALGAVYTADADITLYPHWEGNHTITIKYGTYAPEGHTADEVVETLDKRVGRNYEFTTVWRNTFSQWEDENGLLWRCNGFSVNIDGSTQDYDFDSNDKYTAEEDIILYPYWERVYIVTYHGDEYASGPETVERQTLNKGGYVNLRGSVHASDGIKTVVYESKREWFQQGGWATEEGGDKVYELGAKYQQDADIDLYPYWEPIYKTTYLPGEYGISPDGTEQIIVKKYAGTEQVLKAALFIRSGYTQRGWSTTDGGEKSYNLSGYYRGNADLTLYPYWEKNYTITYIPDEYADSSTVYTDTKQKGVSIRIRTDAFSSDEYKLKGYTVTKGSDSISYYAGDYYYGDEDLTLYPVWEAKTYALSVGNTQVTAANKSDVFGDGKVSFDPETATLTLDSADILTSKVMGDQGAAIYASSDTELEDVQIADIPLERLNIVLTGASTIAPVYEGQCIRSGICANGLPLTISGSGSLTIGNEDKNTNTIDIAIFCSSSSASESALRIKEATLNMFAHYNDIQVSYTGRKGVQIDSGIINATAQDDGGIVLYVDGYRNSTGVIIKGGTVNLCTTGNKTVVQGSDVYPAAINLSTWDSDGILFDGGSVTLENKGEDGYGIQISGYYSNSEEGGFEEGGNVAASDSVCEDAAMSFSEDKWFGAGFASGDITIKSKTASIADDDIDSDSYQTVILGDDVSVSAGADSAGAIAVNNYETGHASYKYARFTGGAVRTYLYIGNTAVTDENLSGTGWAYVPATNTLTLSGIDISTLYQGGEYTYGIFTEEDLNLVLNTNSSIGYGVTLPDTAIFVGGSLTVSGTGSLDASGDYEAIDCKGSITVNSGALDVKGNTAILSQSDFIVEDGMINASTRNSYGHGIYAYGKVKIKAGKVIVNATDYGIRSLGDTVIEDGTVAITAEETAIASDRYIQNGGNVSLVSVCEDEKTAYNYGYALNPDGDVTITGGSLYTEAKYTCIKSDDSNYSTTLTLKGGEIKAFPRALKSYTDKATPAIRFGNVVINGGRLEATGSNYGIYGRNNNYQPSVKINGGSLLIDVSAAEKTYNNYAIFGNITVNMPSSRFRITAENEEYTVKINTGSYTVYCRSNSLDYLEISGINVVSYRPGTNGIGDSTDVVKETGKALELADAIYTKAGHVQTGWALTDGGDKVYNLSEAYDREADLVLYPVWEEATAIIYKPGDATETAEYNDDVPLNGNVTLRDKTYSKAGAIQIGWSTQAGGGGTVYDLGQNITVTGSITLYPVWKTEITLSYDKGRSGKGENVSEQKTIGAEVTLKGAIFTRTGFDLIGWALTDGGEKAYELSAKTSFTEDTTLYPVWSRQYTISYKPGTAAETAEYTESHYEGDAVTLRGITYTADRSIQTGWNTEADGYGNDYELSQQIRIMGDLTLYPVFDRKITLTYNKGSNGTGNNVSEEIGAGKDVTLKAAIFTREGYTQTGWSKTDGGNRDYFLSVQTSFDQDTTLYPYWEKAVNPDPGHTHTLVHHDRVEPTKTTAGNIEYWECSECHKLYSDAEGTNEITRESTVIAAIGGDDPDPNPNPNPDPNPDPNPNPKPAEPVPADPVPLIGNTYYELHVIDGASVKNSSGKEVRTARENETIIISWTEKADYQFVKWNLTGAAPKDAAAKSTSFVMPAQDVTIEYTDKLTVADQVLEQLPEGTDTSVKVNALKFAKNKLVIQKNGETVANPVMTKAAAGAEVPEVYYVTENADIVAVDKQGKFYATGIGETTVTAYCGNKKATCKVSVVCYTQSISVMNEDLEDVSDGKIEMKGGEQTFLTVSFDPYDSTDARTVKWKSDNKKVSVKNGIVTAKEVKEAVSAKVTATVKYTDPKTGKTADLSRTVTVNVKPVEVPKASSADNSHTLKTAKKLTLNMSDAVKASAELKIDLKAKKGDISAIRLSVETTNSEVVSINSVSSVAADGKNGSATLKLEAKAAGTAYIIVKTSGTEGKENVQRCKVTVSNPAKGIVISSGTLKVSNKTMTLRKGSKGTVEAVLDPVYSTDLGKLKISGKGITVKNGIIYANKITKTGKPATITVKCGKLKETISVTVTK